MEKAKKLMVLIAALIFASAGIAYAVSNAYWNHTLSKDITVIGITAIVTSNNYDSYRLKTETSTLDSTNKIILAVVNENYYSLWLNITYTCNGTGLVVSASAQFVTVQWQGPSTGSITPYGSTFNVMGLTTYNATEKPKLMWHDPGTSTGMPTGYGLLISFSFNTEAVTIPGNYRAQIKLQMGFV